MYTQSQKYLAVYAFEILIQFATDLLKNAFKLLKRIMAPRTYMVFDFNNTCVAVITNKDAALNWKEKGFCVFRSVKSVRESQHMKFTQI